MTFTKPTVRKVGVYWEVTWGKDWTSCSKLTTFEWPLAVYLANRFATADPATAAIQAWCVIEEFNLKGGVQDV